MAKKPDDHGPENDAEPALSFEELMKKLEAVVSRLERGDLSLEDSLKSYEEGIALVRSAQGRLDGMDKRLEELLKDGRTAPIADRSEKSAQKPG